MFFEEVWIQHLRCLTQVHFKPSPRQNIFVGDNGSGKTSLLESLYLLGRGQSFRLSNHRRLIQDQQEFALVRASLCDDEKSDKLRLAIQKLPDGTRLRIGNDKTARLSDLARYCPVLILEPGQHRLLEDGPNLRRRFLDWSVFHVEPNYLAIWQRHARALKQRNALLKSKQVKQLSVWNREFVESAVELDRYREKVILELMPFIQELLQVFYVGDQTITVEYRKGWNKDLSLEQQLEQNQQIDLDRGFTQSGPQRAELRVKADGQLARDCLSRGQQKLVITAMLLGQARHFASRRETNPILLIDDLASELGSVAQGKLFQWLQTYSGQSFLTLLDNTAIKVNLDSDTRMFHVKHPGLITSANEANFAI